jgi:acetylornithine deacetylase
MQAATDPSGIVELLSALVACPSVNPGVPPKSGDIYGETRLAGLLADLLRGWGADVRCPRDTDGRPSVVARFDGRDARRSVMFEAHADTVPVDGMTVEPFTPAVRDGLLYGRGACDNKGPMTAMLLAVKQLLQAGPPPVTLYFVATADEEMGGSGARLIVDEGLRPDLVVVGEPTDLRVIHAHKGAVRWRVRTRGRSVHSSRPADGVNAIYMMSRVVRVVEEEIVPSLARVSHPLLGAPTISVGTIRGGSQVNVVPDECEIEIDRRTVPGEQIDTITRDFAARLANLSRQDANFNHTLEITQDYPPFDSERDAAPGRIAAAALADVLGAAEFDTAPWASNAGFFAGAGLPTVLLGPGSIRQAHTADESIALAEIEKAIRVYAACVNRFAACP